MEDLTNGRAFYLVLLGAFVLVWVFRDYRHRLGQGLQHAAIWGLIFVGVILAIGFKDDLTRILTGGPEQIDGQTVALTRQGDGHFHATVEINGQPIRFIVDTGATELVLSQQDAQRIGFNMEDLDFSMPASTANGVVWNAPVTLDLVELGQFRDRSLRAMVNGGELSKSLLGMTYLNLFRGFRVEGEKMYLVR